jgi:plastocyanin
VTFRSFRTPALIGGFLAVSAIAAGCTSGGGANTVVAPRGKFEFAPPTLTIPANTAVTVTLENKDAVIHNWVVQGKTIDIKAQPGKTASGTVNLPAGEYVIVCNEPGHEAAGMVGKLIVK